MPGLPPSVQPTDHSTDKAVTKARARSRWWKGFLDDRSALTTRLARLVDLEITSQGGGKIMAEVTDNPNIALPGWYMLFLVDQNGIPSVAHWVQLV